MKINQVMVIGAGQMGAGIAQVFAQSGFGVYLHDMNSKALEIGMDNIEKRLERSVKKERITASEKEEAWNHLQSSGTLDDARNCELVIEAVVENMDVKTEVFRNLDAIAPPHTLLASNTSSIPITEIAAETDRPEQVIGMHFMNPVPVMELVEIIRGLQTSDDTYQAVQNAAAQLGKTSVEVKDYPAFAANRIVMPMINEAIFALQEDVASKEDIDTVMQLGMNHPMGPLTLADFIGLDTCLYIMEVLHDGFSDSKYRPCPLLRQYVKAGWLGKKTGRGFYTYNS